MKKLLLVIITIISLTTNGQTSYYPFPDSNAVWNCGRYMTCFPIVSISESYSIVLSGDTLINTQTYHKLTIPASIKSYDTTICGQAILGYRGAIRQDTANRKVFMVEPFNNVEELLYDFNMQVGDTVRGITSNTDTVESIDSVLVGSDYRKRWNINQEYNISFIEGVGSTYGLIEPSPGDFIGTFPYFYVNCFSQNNLTLYPDASTNCEIITSLNSIDKLSNHIKIYPNPSSGSFTIDFDKLIIKELALTDLLGNVIFQHRNFYQTKINIDKLASGTYILTTLDDQGRQTKSKIISSP